MLGVSVGRFIVNSSKRVLKFISYLMGIEEVKLDTGGILPGEEEGCV
jgi:hypothetical protein